MTNHFKFILGGESGAGKSSSFRNLLHRKENDTIFFFIKTEPQNPLVSDMEKILAAEEKLPLEDKSLVYKDATNDSWYVPISTTNIKETKIKQAIDNFHSFETNKKHKFLIIDGSSKAIQMARKLFFDLSYMDGKFVTRSGKDNNVPNVFDSWANYATYCEYFVTDIPSNYQMHYGLTYHLTKTLDEDSNHTGYATPFQGRLDREGVGHCFGNTLIISPRDYGELSEFIGNDEAYKSKTMNDYFNSLKILESIRKQSSVTQESKYPVLDFTPNPRFRSENMQSIEDFTSEKFDEKVSIHLTQTYETNDIDILYSKFLNKNI